VQSTEKPPALADAADVLSGQLQAYLERLAKLLRPHAAALERRFLQRLRRRHFDPKQRRALTAITPGAASKLLSARRPPGDFFEQVEYNGRRLAKLNLPPSRVVQALREYDSLLDSVFRTLPVGEQANVRWAREQLDFCVILTLNNAFYQVREAETQAYQELFGAELAARNMDELVGRMLEILTRFCQAEAGVLYLLDRPESAWVLRAATVAEDREEVSRAKIPVTPPRSRRLSNARCLTTAQQAKQVALVGRWHGRYRSCWSIPLSVQGRTEGVMQFGFRSRYEWLPRELELLSAAAERCLLAADKARLVEELSTREEQVRRLAGHMMQVEERERRRISTELHDEAGQSLLLIRLQLEMLERSVPETNVEVRTGLAESRAVTERAIVEVRRLIAALSPVVLEQLGLAAALRQLTNRLRRLHQIQVRLHVSSLGELPRKFATVVYRLVQECTNNIAKHSFASHVNIFVSSADGKLRLRVEDDGVGFKIEEVLGKRDSFGLAGMRERVALFSGKMRVESQPKKGTKILIELPIPERAEH
jgi:signal transduction histidine kinase